ncbi:MAG: DNA-processing protein DprA [Patescibacteria group bacterium]|nr:DNA-processing protein DprA [Patescibacteria group bacterium]
MSSTKSITGDQSSNHDLIYWNTLALFLKFEAKRLKKIADYFPTMKMAFEANNSELIQAGLEQEIVQEFVKWRKTINPEKEWQKLEDEKIKIITIKDKNYPKLLKEIYDPPAILYYKGELKREENYPLAVVGTRKMSFYGREVVEGLVRDLVRVGLTIISGLALGIDGLVHKITLKEGGRTIAVLGGGLDEKTLYPSIHKELARKIIAAGGAIISEYPIGTSPTRYTFPMRNRIISGLSLGTLVIEAPMESGALITARSALDQNREVFAVPGNIYSPNSAGCNWLIKLGAKPVTKATDILESFNLEFLLRQREIKPETKEEEILLKYLSKEPIHIDELIRKSGLTPSQVSATLSIMEIREKIKNLGGGNFILNL